MSDPSIDALAAKKKLEELSDLVARKRQNPDVFLDDQLWVAFTLIADTITMFEELTGRSPTKIHLTKTQELLVEAYRVRRLGVGAALREEPKFMGLKVVFDATYFKLE